jgi:hypothetical protein
MVLLIAVVGAEAVFHLEDERGGVEVALSCIETGLPFVLPPGELQVLCRF